MKTIWEVEKMLKKLPKTTLGFYPSPLQRLDNISNEFGVNIYCKREDFSGMTLFGGNKIRKLEYLFGNAIEKGYDTLITYGATQSNHAMQTATAARKCGIKPILYLAALVEPKEDDIRANLLLDTILGAEIHIVKCLPGEDMDTALKRQSNLVEERIENLYAQGRKVIDIPGGGSSPIGIIGFIDAYVEMIKQLEERNIKPDYMFTATGTGGTMAGLSAGKALLANDCSLIGIQVSPKTNEYPDEIAVLGNEALKIIGADERISTELFQVDGNYFMPGYENPSVEANADIRYLARNEGLFADPVYSGKSFYGMMDYIRSGKIPKGSNVVFIHTGGATALFSEKEIIGDLNKV